MGEWKKQGEHLDVPTYAIVKTRKVAGRWEYLEVEAGVGDWSDLVFALWENFDQFKQEVLPATGNKEIHEKLDHIATLLAKKGEPYEFKLADGTDEWYYGLSKPAVYRVDHEGKLG